MLQRGQLDLVELAQDRVVRVHHCQTLVNMCERFLAEGVHLLGVRVFLGGRELLQLTSEILHKRPSRCLQVSRRRMQVT